MPSTLENVNAIVSNQVLSAVTDDYKQGKPDARNIPSTKPFAAAGQASSPLASFDHSKLDDNQVVDFIQEINLTANKSLPNDGNIEVDSLTPGNLSHGVTPLQHSVWVGGPLKPAENAKHAAFMQALERNQAANSTADDNPKWQVVLWTDQTREQLHNAEPGSPLAEMKAWAERSGVVLANIDEVFAGPNKFVLDDAYQLERNKAGTGRAAVSDIVRLELLNRFGGFYVDGDKPVNLKLDRIAEHASTRSIPMSAEVAQRNGVEVAATHDEDGNPLTVQVSGFSAPKEHGGMYQNCALCSTRNNPVTKEILSTIAANYTKNRADLGLSDIATPQRKEVLQRTGPSVIQNVVDPEKRGHAFMQDGSITTNTGVASWSQESNFRGGKVPGEIKLEAMGTVAEQEAMLAGMGPPPLLRPVGDLTELQQQNIAQAIKGSLTALSYTVPNEGGRLDLNHLTPHLDNLPAEHRAMAVQGVVSALCQPEFAHLHEQITSVRLSKTLPPSVQLLDTIRTQMPQVDMSSYTVQEAIFEGQLSVVKYAEQHNLIDITKKSSASIDPGLRRNQPLPTRNDYLDPLTAAVRSGNKDAVVMIASMEQGGKSLLTRYNEAAPNNLLNLMEEAAKYGQTDVVAYLAEKSQRPDLYAQVMVPSTIYNATADEIEHRAVIGGELRKTANGYEPLSNEQNAQVAALSLTAQRDMLARMQQSFPSEQELLAAKMIEVAAFVQQPGRGFDCPDILLEIEQKAEAWGVHDNLLIASAKKDISAYITIELNKNRPMELQVTPGQLDFEAELHIAQTKFPNAEEVKNGYQSVDAAKMSEKQALEFIQKSMVYSNARLRANTSGSKDRIASWNDLLSQIQTKFPDNQKIQHLAAKSQTQLNGINQSRMTTLRSKLFGSTTERDQQRAAAAALPAPDQSQRTRTSLSGAAKTIRDMMKPLKAPEQSPEGHRFVPGKGMK